MPATVDESRPAELLNDPAIHIPSHGRGWLRPVQKGERLNPRGQLPHRVRLAREVAESVGLKELYELAHQVKRADGAVARALVETALDRGHKGHLAAQKLLWDLLGFAGERAQLEFKQSLEVQVVRQKVRVMDVESESQRGEEEASTSLSLSQEASPTLGSLLPHALVGDQAEGAAPSTRSPAQSPPFPPETLEGQEGHQARSSRAQLVAAPPDLSPVVTPSGLPPLVAGSRTPPGAPCPALEREIPKNGHPL